MNEREYVVTLHRHEDLDSFYEDMETPGGDLYIPDRAVPVFDRRPVSRNTHYMLTEQEAESVKNDPRVMSVVLSLEEQGLSFTHNWRQTSNYWNKSNFINAAHVNWGLLRCSEGQQRANWGVDGTQSVSGTATVTSSGKNVDVVIVDGDIDPDHPEFAVNPDGTGGSRVVQYNWFELNPLVRQTAAGTYLYGPYVDPSYPDLDGDGVSDRTSNNDHGCHVAGTACGNTQGWARDAKIYNLNPYSTTRNSIPADRLIDYIRVWHKNKPINPATGFRNPTITNHSYGVGDLVDLSSITSVKFRGAIYNRPFTSTQLANFGIYVDGSSKAYVTLEYPPVKQDFIDAAAEGVILVGAAMNNFAKIANYSSNSADDYNNYLVKNFSTAYYYNRGSVSAVPGVICVGAVRLYINEAKANFSNCGPRVDVYAPGTLIMSAINSTVGVTVSDPRNSSYKFAKYSGTSMASPQVAGVLACFAEQNPRITQDQALSYVHAFSKKNQMTETSGGPSDYYDLQGSVNRYLYYVKDRPETGQVLPNNQHSLRPASGMTYPRSKIYRYGS